MKQENLAKHCNIRVDSSAFPEKKCAVIEKALSSQVIPSGLLYATDYQAQKWLDIHLQYSPINHDTSIKELYLNAFRDLDQKFSGIDYNLFSFGSGGGNKEALYLKTVKNVPGDTHLIDYSSYLSLYGWQATKGHSNVHSHVADIEVMSQSPELSEHYFTGIGKSPEPSLIFFMGMLPNIPPEVAWSFLNKITRAGDRIAIGANLASPQEIDSNLINVISQYDNESTRIWISAFLENLGILGLNKQLIFDTHKFNFCNQSLAMVRATLEVPQTLSPKYPGLPLINWLPGSELDLFRSVRYSPESINSIASQFNFKELNSFVDGSCQEGIFVLERV